MRVEVRDVRVRIGEAPIIDGIDLTVRPGSLLAIVGPNGSGKTTLLRTIYRAIRPDAGSVLFDDTDARTLSARELAHRRAVVPQFQDGAVGLTAAEIVGTGRFAHRAWWAGEGEADRAAVSEALRRVGAEGYADRAFGTLSGGERQRVLLARALAQQASTLLLDEPTNHLDPRAQLDMLSLLAELVMTRIVVLHDLDHALAAADTVAVLDGGRLVAAGEPAQVLSDTLTRAVFGVRSRIIDHPLTARPHLVIAP